MIRHLQAGAFTIALVVITAFTTYWYYSVPVDVYDIKVSDANVTKGDKLTISYRVHPKRHCKATLIATINDGIEDVRQYSSDLYEHVPPQSLDIVTKDIGLHYLFVINCIRYDHSRYL